MGDKNLRRVLVEAAWVAIRKDGELAQFYSRIRSKRGKEGPCIVIVAVARKLTGRAYRILKDQRPYRIYQLMKPRFVKEQELACLGRLDKSQ